MFAPQSPSSNHINQTIGSLAADGNGFLRDVAATLATLPCDDFNRAIVILASAQTTSRSVYVLGNGGSATTATHLAADLAKGPPNADSAGRRVFSLSDNVALLTAWANDKGYRDVFAEMIRTFVRRADVVVAVSVSGTSPNIINALQVARRLGASTIGLFGDGGRQTSHLCDACICVNSDDYGVVETIHLAIAHGLASALRSNTGYSPHLRTESRLHAENRRR